MDTTKAKTIADRFNDKLDKTGGTITGNTTLSGNFNSRVAIEFDAADATLWGVGTNVVDIGADSGSCRRVAVGSGTGTVLYEDIDLRYGDYVFCIRMKVGNNTLAGQANKIGEINISHTLETNPGLYAVKKDILPTSFASTDYEMIYIYYRHKKNVLSEATRPSIILSIDITNGNITTLSIDSVLVMPIHTGLYDLD